MECIQCSVIDQPSDICIEIDKLNKIHNKCRVNRQIQ